LWDEAHENAGQRGLAATGFADDAQRLALEHDERDIVYGLDGGDLAVEHSAMNREVLFKMLHDQKRLGLASAIARIVGRYPRWRIKARPLRP
jgi:hypothetical protein